MPARSKARKRALDILFEAEISGEPVLDLLAERSAAERSPDGTGPPPVSSYAAELVRGVQAHRDRIDELLAEHSQGWTLDRMPAVDRNILRIGVYELLWAARRARRRRDQRGGAARPRAVHRRFARFRQRPARPPAGAQARSWKPPRTTSAPARAPAVGGRP